MEGTTSDPSTVLPVEIQNIRKDIDDLKNSLNLLISNSNKRSRSTSPDKKITKKRKSEQVEEGEVIESIAGPSGSKTNTLTISDDFDLLTSDSDSDQDKHSDSDCDLDELEEVFGSSEKYGPKIEDKLCKLIDSGLTKNPSSDVKIKEVCKKYPRPENSKNLRVPRTNLEIWKLLSKGQKAKDIRLQKIQNLTTKSAIASSNLLDELRNKKSMDNKQIKSVITDILRLNSAAFTELSLIRKESIKPGLTDQFKPLCNTSTEDTYNSTELLFGENLNQKIKDLSETSKLTNQIGSKNFMGGRSFQFRKQKFQPQGSDPTKRKQFPQKGSYKKNQWSWKRKNQ